LTEAGSNCLCAGIPDEGVDVVCAWAPIGAAKVYEIAIAAQPDTNEMSRMNSFQ
jgi:hypothetical protein